MYLDCLHSAGISYSSAGDRVTASPDSLVYCEKSSSGSLCRLVPYIGNRRCTVTAYIASGAMTSGDSGGSRPRVDHRGVTFRNKLQTAWNASESYVTLGHLSGRFGHLRCL